MTEFTKQIWRLGVVWSVAVVFILLLEINGQPYSGLTVVQKVGVGAGLVAMVAAVIFEVGVLLNYD